MKTLSLYFDFEYDGGGWYKCKKCGYSYAR